MILFISVAFAKITIGKECNQKNSETIVQSLKSYRLWSIPEIYGPAYNILSPSTLYTFTSDVEGTWRITGGTIISGQGTDEISIKADVNPFNGYNQLYVSVENNDGINGKSYLVSPSNWQISY